MLTMPSNKRERNAKIDVNDIKEMYTNSQTFHLKHDILIIQVGIGWVISILRNIHRILLNVLQLVLHTYNHVVISHMIMCICIKD